MDENCRVISITLNKGGAANQPPVSILAPCLQGVAISEKAAGSCRAGASISGIY